AEAGECRGGRRRWPGCGSAPPRGGPRPCCGARGRPRPGGVSSPSAEQALGTAKIELFEGQCASGHQTAKCTIFTRKLDKH
ncbi:hypothetical protein Nmel_001251, partial [Mimus melanotis]